LAPTEWTNTVRQRFNGPPRAVSEAETGGAATPVIDVTVRFRGDGVCILDVDGDIDMLTAPILDSMVARQLQSHPRALILDLDDVGFLSSAGLASLMAARDAARDSGTRFRLVSNSQPVLRPLTVTGLTGIFEIHADLDAALL
jgi:anti-sigma B factor antagonist